MFINNEGTIPLEEWEEEENGYVYYVRSRLLREIRDDLSKALEKEGLLEEGVYYHSQRGNETFPHPWRSIACFAVTGTNEGHYVHVEVFLDGVDTKLEHKAKLLFSIKTFLGFEKAQHIAAACTRLLGA